MDNLNASQLEQMNVVHYITLIPFTLLVHEYCITFTLEVERFWVSSRLTWASFLFFLNRYFTLFGHIPVVAEYFLYSAAPNTTRICSALQSYHQYFSVVVQVVIASEVKNAASVYG